ncbi:hypothetical protein BH11PSE13_BH11PSE13_27170 [soil metagenome]
MNAWIDCMSYLDDSNAGTDAGMTTAVRVPKGEQLVICVEHAAHMKKHCPDVWLGFLECAAFVNWRCTEESTPPLLIVAAFN